MEIRALVVMLRNVADEMERIEDALGTLQGVTSSPKRRAKGKRMLSAEARAAISKAQKERWAKVKKAAK